MNLQQVKTRYQIIGNSEGLNTALDKAIRIAASDLTVMINGESGVGKDVFSKVIHELSPRKHNDFIAVNTGAIPQGTIDSELFGHEKGAFTDATKARKGYFESVNGGTIFLDEIAEMPLGTQARLLRVLESGEFIKVGSSEVMRTDVRVITATNVNLEDAVAKGKFRKDLFFRLNTVPIYVPPLRDRGEDIILLFRKFASDFNSKYRNDRITLSDNSKALLINYSWPGNIRELKNLAERISALSSSSEISRDELLGYLPEAGRSKLPAIVQDTIDSSSSAIENEFLLKMLLEMKKDINELKGLSRSRLRPEHNSYNEFEREALNEEYRNDDFGNKESGELKQIVLDDNGAKNYNSAEIIEESLSIADMEKRLILKALEKHKGKRRKAAEELEISERTLYRKLREYELEQ